MNKSRIVTYVVVLFLGVILLLVAFIVAQCSSSETDQKNSSTFRAYYQNGVVRARMHEYTSLKDFQRDMTHEWAHEWYETQLTRADLKEWLRLVNTCKFESDYSFTLKMSKGQKIYEEWAQCTQLQAEGSLKCCIGKRELISRSGVLTEAKK